jgi:hypothetical protein
MYTIMYYFIIELSKHLTRMLSLDPYIQFDLAYSLYFSFQSLINFVTVLISQ